MWLSGFLGGWGGAISQVRENTCLGGAEKTFLLGGWSRLPKDLQARVSYGQLCVRVWSSDERGLERDWGGMRVQGRAATRSGS